MSELIVETQGKVVTVTLNRPPVNALTLALYERIAETLPAINVWRCGGGAHIGRHGAQGVLWKMFFTGRPISADEAYRVNLVAEVVSADRLMDAARELAGVISEKAPLGLRMGKKALNDI